MQSPHKQGLDQESDKSSCCEPTVLTSTILVKGIHLVKQVES